jgi:hypothetical protein
LVACKPQWHSHESPEFEPSFNISALQSRTFISGNFQGIDRIARHWKVEIGIDEC